MKKNILSMAALLMASAAVFTACSSDDNITSEQPANPTGKYTMTVNASKGGDATTRALSLDETTSPHKLNATWDENEVVLVYQNGSQIGTLRSAASATNETTLTGELDSAPDAGQDLTLYFHTNATPSYAGQDGTLATIASTYDFCAPATITAGSFTVSGSTVSTTSSASFGANQQAIVKFTLIDKADGTTPLSATQLVVNDGTTDYTITPASNTSVIYAAIPGFTGQTVTLTATVGDDTYTYEKTGVSFTNGQYYEIGVKMTKKASALIVNPTVGQVIGSDGKNYAADAALPDGVTKVAKIFYVGSDNGEATPYNHGLALALSDANGGSSCKWSTSTTQVHTYNTSSNSFESESGLQYNDATHNTDAYPAFQAAIANNGTAAPTGCSAWFLASGYQWKKMADAAGGDGKLGLASRVHWSSTEYDANRAWYFLPGLGRWLGGNKGSDCLVRSCLAF